MQPPAICGVTLYHGERGRILSFTAGLGIGTARRKPAPWREIPEQWWLALNRVEARGAFFESVSRLTRLPLIPADGSVVIRDGEIVLGAVGVSGAKPEEDRECAEAGRAAVLSG